MSEATFDDQRPMLTPKERELAIAAIGSRVSGTPADAATQLLVGIAVLDGRHLPIQVWSAGMGLEDAANWHERNAIELRERNARIQARIRAVSPSEQTAPSGVSDCLQTSVARAQPQQDPASSAPDRREAGTDSLPPLDP